MRKIQIVLALSFGMVTSLAAQATLLGRDVNGSPGSFEAYYDDQLDITWLGNPSLAETLTLGLEKGGTLGNSGIDAYGRMPWTTAQLWIAALNTLNYLGINDWRLPNANPINGTAYNFNPRNDGSRDVGINISAPGTIYAGSTAHELAHLFFDTLGNHGSVTPDGLSSSDCGGSGEDDCMVNPGPFPVLDLYDANFGVWWYGVATSSGTALNFEMDVGRTNSTLQSMAIGYAWPVVGGDVFSTPGGVPEPATMGLVALGLAGLGLARRRGDSLVSFSAHWESAW